MSKSFTITECKYVVVEDGGTMKLFGPEEEDRALQYADLMRGTLIRAQPNGYLTVTQELPEPEKECERGCYCMGCN